MNIGEYIKLARKRRRVTLMQMAEATGISYTMLARIETHHLANPSPNILREISDYLGVAYSQLLIQAGYLSQRDLNQNEPTAIPLIDDRIFLARRSLGLVHLLTEFDLDVQVWLDATFAVRISGHHSAPFPTGYIVLIACSTPQASDICVVQAVDGSLIWATQLNDPNTMSCLVSLTGRKLVTGEVIGWAIGCVADRFLET